MRRAAFLITLIMLGGCASSPDSNHQSYLKKKGLATTQTVSKFEHCYDYGCEHVTQVSLGAAEWNKIARNFSPRPLSAEAERERIKSAIAAFEQTVGAKTGTDADKWGTFRNMGAFQQDCVDESTNTTVYLMLLADNDLLRFHTVQAPTMRFPLIHAGRWPHQTAVIREKDSGTLYAVDSWFHDNGAPAEIILLKQWKEGWKPDREDASPDAL